MDRFLRIQPIFLILFIVMSGCHTETSTLNTSTSTIVPFTLQPTASLTPSPSATPTATHTETVMPTITRTLTIKITPTFLPTLSKTKAVEMAETSFTSQLCKLPCWLNITPGITRWEDAKLFLQTFTRIEGVNSNIELHFPNPFQYPFIYSKSKELGMSIQVWPAKGQQDLLVQWITTFRVNYPIYQLLDDYGPPSEIWYYVDVDLAATQADKEMWYELILFYRDQGFLAWYTGNMRFGPTAKICPSNIAINEPNPYLELWSPTQIQTLEQATHYTNGIKYDVYGRLDDTAGITDQEFYKLYKSPENASKCIDVPNRYYNGK
jgi:hypothetical protein